MMRNIDNDRDRSIERLLRETLHARTTTACLDPETAAAWADDALGPDQRSKAEAHAAGCARCQALLAALVRTSPPTAARSWFRLPTIGWLAPLTAVAAGLLVWMILPPPARFAPADRSVSRVDELAKAPAAAPVASAPTQSKLEAPAPKLKAASSAPGRTDIPLVDARAQQERDRLEKTAPASPPPAPAAAPASSAAPNAVPPVPAPAPSSAQDAAPPAATVAEQKALASPATAGSVFARRLTDARQQTVIVSTNPSIQWRIGADGAVLHTVDGGSTWETQRTGVASTLTAGASPSPSTCWLVGPRGIVLLSTDGRSWQTLPFQEKVDLVSVRPTDDKTATVTAADGRTFSTTDRGLTWTPSRSR
jgi:hypothetical protein